MYDDIEPESYPMIRKIQKCVMDSEELSDDIELLKNWLVNWTGIFLHSVYHEFKIIDKYNSMFFCLLQSQSYQIEWIIFSLFSGQYDMVNRELRTILENAFYHFKFDYDDKYLEFTIEEKRNEMNKLSRKDKRSTYGIGVFRSSQYKYWNEAYNNIYKQLCKYIHTKIGMDNAYRVYEEGFNSLLDPKFDEIRMTDTIKMLKKIIKMEINMMEEIMQKTYKSENNNYSDIFND